jgi:hypothetical protein
MRRNTTSKILASLAVFGVVAAGGSAFTASNGLPATKKLGYDTTSISGATASNVSYQLSTNGSKIEQVKITFAGDVSASTIEAGFNDDALTACATKVFDNGTPGSTLVTCAFADQGTTTADKFNVLVT